MSPSDQEQRGVSFPVWSITRLGSEGKVTRSAGKVIVWVLVESEVVPEERTLGVSRARGWGCSEGRKH